MGFSADAISARFITSSGSLLRCGVRYGTRCTGQPHFRSAGPPAFVSGRLDKANRRHTNTVGLSQPGRALLAGGRRAGRVVRPMVVRPCRL